MARLWKQQSNYEKYTSVTVYQWNSTALVRWYTVLLFYFLGFALTVSERFT